MNINTPTPATGLDSRLHVPAEGENGLFSESWFAICPSEELKQGQIVSKTFLDGKIIVVRDEKGKAHVLSAFCPHLGAHLGVGKIEDGLIRCAFHKWGYEAGGRCANIPSGDPIPPRAKLFQFPTLERYGMIWAFNGKEAWWQVPDMPYPEDQLSIRVRYDAPLLPVDPWVICSNTPDWHHFTFVHRMKVDSERIAKTIKWTDHSMEFDMCGTFNDNGIPFEFHVGIFGTSMFRLYGEINGEWMASFTPFGMPKPGTTQNHFITMFKKSPEITPEQEEFKHMMMVALGKSITRDDQPILQTVRYRPGLLTKADAILSKYFELLRGFPRSHHSGEFIR